MRLFIFGAGGHGRDVLRLVRMLIAHGTAIEVAGFVVEAGYVNTSCIDDIPVHEHTAVLQKSLDAKVIVAIGAPAVRRRIVRLIGPDGGEQFPKLIHPHSVREGDNVAIGQGSVIFPGLLAGSDVRIGSHVLTHHHVHIGHDTVVDDFVTIAPGALVGGRAHIGEGTLLGIGARVLPKIRIGRWSVIGAGAVVTRDIPDRAVAYGVPARVVSVDEAAKQFS